MTLGTAACITGTDTDLISHVPDLRGMRNDVIVLRSHRYSYDHGVRSAGMLLGRSDLIEAARLNNSPNSDTVGRGMKVSKEEILGMLAAVEVSLTYDYSVEHVRETGIVNLLAEKFAAYPGIRTEVTYPKTEGGRPHLRIIWDRSTIPLSVEQAQDLLEQGDPSIRTCYLGLADGHLEIGTAMLKEEEVDIVVRRVGEVLAPAT